MATARVGKTGKSIKLNKDGTIPKKHRRKTPMPPHRGIESPPVGQIKIGNGSPRDLIRFLLGNTDLKVVKGKKAIAEDEKRILRDRALLTSRKSASEVSAMAGDLARSRIMNLSPTDFEITRSNMRQERNMGLTGDSMGIGVQDEVIFSDNVPKMDSVQGGPPVNPMLERGRAEAARFGGPTVANRRPPPRPPVELPFGENPNVAPDFANMESPQGPPAQPERPQPLKYSPYDKPQQRGAVPEAAMTVSRAQDARKYGLLGGVDEDKTKEYEARQMFNIAPLSDYAHGGKIKKKRRKKLAGGGKVTSYNY